MKAITPLTSPPSGLGHPIPTSLRRPQTEDILHVVDAVLPTDDPERRPDRTAGKIVPAVGPVDEFQSLPHPAEDHRMLADDVPGPESLDADLLFRPFADHPLPAVHADLVEISAETLRDDLRHLERGAARGVLFHVMVGLDDLDIVLITEDSGDIGQHLEKDN